MTGQEFGRKIEGFCNLHFIPLPFQMEPIRAGRNSQVLKLSHGDRNWILKNYFELSGRQHDRLGTEFNFLVFLRNMRVVGTPHPLGMDRNSHCALYSFLPGNRPNIIAKNHIDQAANFIRIINRFRALSAAVALPLAVDACLSWQDHLLLPENRISRLISIKPDSEEEVDAYGFITKQLAPLWLSVKTGLIKEIPASELTKKLPLAERILSPSDFGFHNTLDHEGRLAFVDFEYAGWDDPAKLICDFMCQPDLPVTRKQGWQFMRKLLHNWPYADKVVQRVDKLLLVHRLKWCCILLNEFRIEDRERRLHAGIKSNGMLAYQLSKAKSYFKVHLSPFI